MATDTAGPRGALQIEHPQRFQAGRRTRVAEAVTVALVAGIASGPLLAQEIEEIIVTATKRDESVMDVPLAITAMSGQYIREVNLDDVKDLIAFTPGVTGNSKDSFLDVVSFRGIRTIDFGNGGDPSVAVYKNGLYQGRNGAARRVSCSGGIRWRARSTSLPRKPTLTSAGW